MGIRRLGGDAVALRSAQPRRVFYQLAALARPRARPNADYRRSPRAGDLPSVCARSPAAASAMGLCDLSGLPGTRTFYRSVHACAVLLLSNAASHTVLLRGVSRRTWRTDDEDRRGHSGRGDRERRGFSLPRTRGAVPGARNSSATRTSPVLPPTSASPCCWRSD